jgi:orotidine-5'-phosphate decarboxylase
MIRAAADAAAEFGASAPRILAVTVLTSMDEQDLRDVGIAGRTPAEQVSAMAQFAVGNGADGLVCSPREVGALSKALKQGTLFVTPGVRPAGAAVGDQKRVATPADAVRDGATHLVVGRPILAAEDPVAAAAAILKEMSL